MKTQVSAVTLALAASSLATTTLAFSASSTPTLTAVATTRVSSMRLEAVSRELSSSETGSSSSTALMAAMVDSDEFLESEIASMNDLLEQGENDISPTDIDATPAYLQDGFVFGLNGSGPERPKGKVSNVVVEGDTLETQTYQVAIVAGTMLGHAGFAGVNYMELLSTNGGDVAMTSIQMVVLATVGWLMADLGSGVLHWSVDNYGNGKTPVMGSIIAAFQGHHSAPWTITERGFCNNVYKLCTPFGVVPMALINLLAGPMVSIFFVFFCVSEIMSQEFHKWSHMTKKENPGWVTALQDVGLTIGRTPHAMHHLAPYDGNYCIVAGIWNKSLDQSGLFRWMEHQVYNINGVEANAWKIDPELRERTLSGDYSLPESHLRRYR